MKKGKASYKEVLESVSENIRTPDSDWYDVIDKDVSPISLFMRYARWVFYSVWILMGVIVLTTQYDDIAVSILVSFVAFVIWLAISDFMKVYIVRAVVAKLMGIVGDRVVGGNAKDE